MKKIILSIILLFFVCQSAFCSSAASFNLAGVIESIISYQNKTDFISDVSDTSKEQFIYASNNFRNGNVAVAYIEFQKTIDMLDKNLALLMLSKRLYEWGFFSLGDSALDKISGKEKIQNQIEELKKSYNPSYKLSKDEEIYLTKAYASIYYNNSPEEVAFNLIKKTGLMENSDYANFIMAKSMFECRQYNQALIYVDKAILKNPENSNYKYFKAKTLAAGKKYKEALKYIKENKDTISVFFVREINILEKEVLSYLAPHDEDKKFYQIYTYYLDGNYYRTVKETKNILNFYKNNPKILTLQAMANLALGNVDEAKNDFNLSYKQNKNFDLTLMGLADCNFIEGNYSAAYKTYKKLEKTELSREALLKMSLALSKMENSGKKLAKLNKKTESFEKSSFLEYYIIANNLFKEETEKKKFVAKSLGINFLNKDTWDILFDISYENKDFNNIDKLVFLLLFLDDMNAEYYYYSAVSMNSQNQKREAFHELQKAINLNPDYKPAIDLMNRLQNELI